MQCRDCRRVPAAEGGQGWYALTNEISLCTACKPGLALCARGDGRPANPIMRDDLCNECRSADTLARHAALKAAHPESFTTFRGRDRRRWTN